MTLSEAIERYLRAKRFSGLAYETEGFILSAFQRFVKDALIEEVTSQQVIEFLNFRQCSNGRWMTKHSCLKMFFEYWADRGCASVIPLPRPRRRDRDRVPEPFIYTRIEVQKLIQATIACQSSGHCSMSGKTFRAVLLTLYATGARTGEIFWLKRNDLDLKRNLILLSGDKKILPRTIPFNRDLHEELKDYLQSKERKSAPHSPNVFVSCRGEPLCARSFSGSFTRLRILSGVLRIDGDIRVPRLCDFRPTFAVHRIASWFKEGADLNRLLPALSAYLGLSDLSSVQRFLRMTPERFKRELNELSPYKSRKHWRDNPALMKFLDSLN